MWELPDRNRTRVPCIGRRILSHWTTREAWGIFPKYRFWFSGSGWCLRYWQSNQLPGRTCWPRAHTSSSDGLGNPRRTFTLCLLTIYLAPSCCFRLWFSSEDDFLLAFWVPGLGQLVLKAQTGNTWPVTAKGSRLVWDSAREVRCTVRGPAELTVSINLFIFWSLPGLPSLTVAQDLPSAR